MRGIVARLSCGASTREPSRPYTVHSIGARIKCLEGFTISAAQKRPKILRVSVALKFEVFREPDKETSWAEGTEMVVIVIVGNNSSL